MKGHLLWEIAGVSNTFQRDLLIAEVLQNTLIFFKMHHSKLGAFWLITCREVITANPTCQKQETMYLIQCNAVTIGVYSQHLKVVELVSFGLLTWVMPYKYTAHCILEFRWWNWKQYVLKHVFHEGTSSQNSAFLHDACLRICNQ
jgi:hypothetical protein